MLGQETGMELKEWKKKWWWISVRPLAEILYVQPERFMWRLVGFLKFYQQTVQSQEATFKLLAMQ